MFCADNTENIHTLSKSWSLIDMDFIFHMLPKGLYMFHTVNILTYNVNKNSLQNKYTDIILTQG